MKHLTDEQLSARLDRALTGRAHEEAERHLAECAQCRNALAALTAQDRFLGVALAHDPGEEYFASFAARVEDRLRADGIRGAQARLRDDQAPWFRWFHAPRRVAWAGAVATIVAGAAIVLVTTREDRVPRLHAPELESRMAETGPAVAQPETPPSDVIGSQAAPASPSAAGRKDAERLTDLRSQERDAASQTPVAENLPEGAGASPARMRQVGAPATTPMPQMAQQSAPAPAAPEGHGVRVMKRNTAQPMQSKDQAYDEASQSTAAREETAPAPATLQARDPAPAGKQKASATPQASAFAPPPSAAGLVAGGTRAGEVQLCGQVLDTQGRPVAHASVALVTLGRTATSGESGSFCMSAPDGSYELSVMAVGFEPSRMQVKVAGERSDVRVTLAAISVMDGLAKAPAARLDAGEPVKLNATSGSTKTEAKSDAKKTTASTTPAKPQPKDPFAGESKASAQAAATAMAATRYASTYPTLPTWSKAAELWGGAAEAVKTPSGRAEALYRIAEARVNVWRQYPTPTRKNDALSTCMTVISGTPTPEQRRDALKWADEVRRGPTGRD